MREGGEVYIAVKEDKEAVVLGRNRHGSLRRTCQPRLLWCWTLQTNEIAFVCLNSYNHPTT
jgi:hypothetical protein